MLCVRHILPPRGRLVATAAALALFLAAPPAGAADPGDDRALAAAAWNDGRHDEALAAYDRLLAREPDDWTALVRTAKILSWTERYDAAADRFGRALALRPDDREARLGLARTYAWSGRYDEARAEYERLLASDPDDVEALVGTAKTYAWSGDLGAAREVYARALRVAPADVDARVGLAYVDLWSGDLTAAARRSAELDRDSPEHGDVVELRRRIDAATAPGIRGRVEHLSDTDDNDLDVVGVRGDWRVLPRLGLAAGYARFEMSDPTGDASIDAVDAAATLYPSARHRITLSAGVDRRTATDGERSSEGVGGVRWDTGVGTRRPVWLSASRVPIRYSPRITDNGITLDELAAGIDARVGERWRIHAVAATADVSDDNSRLLATASARARVRAGGPAVEVGGTVRFMDYDRDTAGGYFDPAGFLAVMVHAAAWGETGGRGVTWRVEATTGLQSFTRGQDTIDETDVSGDGVVVLAARLGVPLGRGVTLEGFVEWGDYAAQNAGGFESTTAGLHVVWRGGDR